MSRRMRRCAVRYGVVAASIIALDPDPNVFGGALNRCWTILIGSFIGVATAFLVWPTTATRRAHEAIQQALGACRDLLEAEADQQTHALIRALAQTASWPRSYPGLLARFANG